LREMGDQVECGLARGLAALLKTFMPFLALRIRENIGRAALDVSCDAHHVGMVGDNQPVERSAQLDRQPAR